MTTILEDIRNKLDKKYISSEELTQEYIKKITTFNKIINSFISINVKKCIIQAQKADLIISQKKQNLFTGVPIAHKDNLCTNVLKTTCASKMLENYYSPFNATIVERLEKKGVILLGKTNMDEFAMGSTNENSFFGSVKNPHNIECIPGGSSGGSAASVAALLSPFATGSDTGGSVRQPAGLCGITGIKPSYGTLSRFGLISYASSLDQVGFLSHFAKDCGYFLDAMSGQDKKDSTSIKLCKNFFTKTINEKIKTLSIGIDETLISKLSVEAQKKFEDCITVYKKLGAKIKSIQLPNLDTALSTYYIIAPAEAATNLARYDGIRYGYRGSSNNNDLENLYINTRTQGFGKEVKRRIVIGNYVLAESQYDDYYYKAQQIRQNIKLELNNLYNIVNIILLPTTDSTACKLNSHKNIINNYLSDKYTSIANLTGCPAIAFPIGNINNLPFSAQIITKNFQDYLLIQTVHSFQKETNFHLPNKLLLKDIINVE